ncbi:hypothetical protein ACS25C_03930 [Dickeya undicola]|uniref:hypothetical protein n=1 Tax=Dickeya undicola TaxID=1577887 RepID=UPI003F23D1BD
MTDLLSKERLQQIADWREHPALCVEAQQMAQELLQRREAAEKPLAYTEQSEITNMQATGLYLRGFPSNSQGRDIALYTKPPLPVVPPAYEPTGDVHDYYAGWNACRAAMLQPSASSCHLSGNPEQVQSRIDAAVALLKQAAPAMLAEQKDPDGALVGPIKSGERVEFEKWYLEHWKHETGRAKDKTIADVAALRSGSGYAPAYTNGCWNGWKGRAAIAVRSPVTPEGWKLVPIEPTEAMLIALHRDVIIEAIPSKKETNILNEKTVWASMLDVAPQPDHFPDAPNMVGPALRDVIAERERQIAAEGWTTEHDDEHVGFEMSFAAATYIMHIAQSYGGQQYKNIAPTEIWPWDLKWLKFAPGPRRSLIKAAALILAEIERLDRAAPHSEGGDA